MQQKSQGATAIFLSLCLVAGCGGPGSRPRVEEQRPLEGVVVRVACPDETTREVVDLHSRGWAARTGARVETALFEEGRPPAADAWVLRYAELPRHVEQLRPLGKPGSSLWKSLLPLYGERLLCWDEQAYAVPLVGDAPLCFYRKDLFEQKSHQEAFERDRGRKLGPPATWDDYAAVAEYFREARKGTPSLPPLPKDPRALDALFYHVAAPHVRKAARADLPFNEAGHDELFSFHFDLKTGQPRIGGQGFAQALKHLQRLQRCRPAGDAAEPWRAFRDGAAVLCLGDARLLARFQERDSKVYDAVGVCTVPGTRDNRVPYLGAGGHLLAVPRSATQAEAAIDLLTELGGERVAQQVALEPRWGGGAVREGQLSSGWEAFRLPVPQQTELGSALRLTLLHRLRNPVLVLRVPDEQAFVTALVEELRPALLSGDEASATKALRNVEKKWAARVAQDPARHLADYRLSLGLRARK